MRTTLERVSDMGWETEKGRVSQAGGKTHQTIPTEWTGDRGAKRPLEWRKTLTGIARDWAGESIRQGAPKTPEWKGCPGGKNLRSDP